MRGQALKALAFETLANCHKRNISNLVIAFSVLVATISLSTEVHASDSAEHDQSAASSGNKGKARDKSVGSAGPGSTAQSPELETKSELASLGNADLGLTGALVGAAEQPNTSALSLKTALKSKKKSKFSFDFYMEVDGFPAAVKNHTPTAANVQYFAGPKYALSDSTVIYFRPQWNTVYSEASAPSAPTSRAATTITHVGDAILGISDSKLARWGKDGTLTGIARYYLPTGEASRKSGQNGVLYGRTIANQQLNKTYSVMFQTISEYWLQSNKTLLGSDGKRSGTPNFELVPFVAVNASVNKHLDFTQSLGMDYTFVHGDKAFNVDPQAITQVYFDTSVSTDLIPSVSLSLGLNNEPTVNSGSGFHAYRDSDMYFYLMMFASL